MPSPTSTSQPSNPAPAQPDYSNDRVGIGSYSPRLAREGDSGTARQPLFDLCLDGSYTTADHDISVAYTLVDDSAMASVDYVADSSRVVIPAGSTCVTMSAQIMGNTVTQQDRSFKVQMSDIQGGVFDNDSSTLAGEGVIVDDDGSTLVGDPTAKLASGWAAPVSLSTFAPLYVVDYPGYHGYQGAIGNGELPITSNIDPQDNILVAWYDAYGRGGHQLGYNYLWAMQGSFQAADQLASVDKPVPVSRAYPFYFSTTYFYNLFFAQSSAFTMTHNLFGPNWLYWLDQQTPSSLSPANLHAGTPETVPVDPDQESLQYSYNKLAGETDASGRSALIASSSTDSAPGFTTSPATIHFTRSQKATSASAWDAPTGDNQPTYGAYAPGMTTNGQGQQFYADFFNNNGQTEQLQLYALPTSGTLGTPEVSYVMDFATSAVQLKAGTTDVVALWTACPATSPNSNYCNRQLFGAVRDASGHWTGPTPIWAQPNHLVQDPYRGGSGPQYKQGAPTGPQLAVNKAGDAVAFFYGCGTPAASSATMDPENCGYHLSWHKANASGAWQAATMVDPTDTVSSLTALRVTLDDDDVVTLAYSAAQDNGHPFVTRTRRIYLDGRAEVDQDFTDMALGDLTQQGGHVLLTLVSPEYVNASSSKTTSTLYATIFADSVTGTTPTVPALPATLGAQGSNAQWLWQPPWAVPQTRAPFLAVAPQAPVGVPFKT